MCCIRNPSKHISIGIFHQLFLVWTNSTNPDFSFCISEIKQNGQSTMYREIFNTTSSVKLVATIGTEASPKKGTKPGVQKGMRFLLACHARLKCTMETTRYSVKVKLGIKLMKLVKNLIGWDVTVTGRWSECHLTFVIEGLHTTD